MSDLALSRPHTAAVIARLESQGLVVGDAGDPEDEYGWPDIPGQSQFVPYVIVYPAERQNDGSLGCPDEDSEIEWTVTCVGSTREQCEWLHDKVDATLIGHVLTVADRSLPRLWSPFGSFTRRDDTVQPPTYIATPRYRLVTTPS